MPCRVDTYPCPYCGSGDSDFCGCRQLSQQERDAKREHRKRALEFDYEGALCDVLRLVEKRAPATLALVDKKIISRWRMHRKNEEK